MQQVRVDCVVFSNSCIRSESGAGASGAVTAALDGFLSGESRWAVFVEDARVPPSGVLRDGLSASSRRRLIVIARQDGDWSVEMADGAAPAHVPTLARALAVASARHGVPPGQTVSVAGDESGLLLRERSRLHFHVGHADCLKRKHRGLVPLVGQWEQGLANVMRHFTAVRVAEVAIDHADIVRFAESSRSFYASDQSPSVMLGKARRAAAAIRERFPGLPAIFGGGYPFYLTGDDAESLPEPTPQSILRYMHEQSEYFARKVMPGHVYDSVRERVMTGDELEARLNVTVARNVFDAHEYEKFGVTPPPEAGPGLSVAGHLEHNGFDVDSDVWPCFYCSTLQNPDKYPEQRVAKEFTLSCLACRQTSLLPRNVTGCSSDVDLIVFVDGKKESWARKMKAFLSNHPEFHIYDTDFVRMFIDGNGPLDLFVAEVDELWRALEQMLRGDWMGAMLPSMAVWLPITPHELELGSNFVLCFEPLAFASEAERECFETYRRRFAEKVPAEEVVRRLSAGSFYHRQLLSNERIRAVIARRLAAWNRSGGTGVLNGSALGSAPPA